MFIILDLVFAMFPSAIVKSRWFFFQVPNREGLSHGGHLAQDGT